MKWLVAVILVVVVAIGAAVWWVEFGRGSPVAVATSDIKAIEFRPVPEGPPEAGFTRGVPDRWHVPIQLVEQDIPSPLPAPEHQGIGCNSGYEVVFTLHDGRSVTYGPCRVPGSIVQFRAEAFAAINDYISKEPSADEFWRTALRSREWKGNVEGCSGSVLDGSEAFLRRLSTRT